MELVRLAAFSFAFGLAVLAAGCSSGGQKPTTATPAAEAPATQNTRAPVSTATPTPEAAPMVVPDGPVDFTVCAEISGFRKLTPQEMGEVFTNRRFGDGTRAGPFYWAIYQSSYYWIQDPHAASANVENFALSRGVATGSGLESSPPLPACLSPDERNGDRYQALWMYDHRAVAMRAASGVLTVVVEPAPATWQAVEFPYPAVRRTLPPLKSDSPLFTGLRIVDPAGQILALFGRDRWQFDDTGALVSGIPVSAASLRFRLGIDLEVICSRLPQGPASLTFAPASGAAITVQATGCIKEWDVAASVHLEPGDWTIEAGGGSYYTVLPKNGPRP